jgi:uncharacterized Fe-S radical SAM superfamily protein PflX
MARFILLLGSIAFVFSSFGQRLSVNPQVKSIVAQVSADRIADIQKKLESFGTRNIYSSTTDPEHGIGAAQRTVS